MASFAAFADEFQKIASQRHRLRRVGRAAVTYGPDVALTMKPHLQALRSLARAGVFNEEHEKIATIAMRLQQLVQNAAMTSFQLRQALHSEGPQLPGRLRQLGLRFQSIGNRLVAGASSPSRDGQEKTAYVKTFTEELWLIKSAAVRPTQQLTQWTCSAACLKAVLAHYGKQVPELEAIQAIGARKGRGAETDQIVDGARKLGFEAYEKSFDTIEQAKELTDAGNPIICDIQSFNNPGKGHYVVLTKVEGDEIHLMDPNTPRNERVISRAEMEARWWDRAMRPPHAPMIKWGVVVVPRETPSPDRYGNESGGGGGSVIRGGT